MSKAKSYLDIEDGATRHQFIDIETGEDVFDSLRGKMITFQEPVKELRETQRKTYKEHIQSILNHISVIEKKYEENPNSGLLKNKEKQIKLLEEWLSYDEKEFNLTNFGVFEEELDEPFSLNWDLVGFWFADGLEYALQLGNKFKNYLFNKGKHTSNYIYEIIPSKNMKIYQETEDSGDSNEGDEDYEAYIETLEEEDEVELSYRDVLTNFDGANRDDSLYEPKDSKYHGVIWRLKKGFQLKLLYICEDTECIDKNLDIWRFNLRRINSSDAENMYNLIF